MSVELFLSAVAGAATAAGASKLSLFRARVPRIGASPRISAQVRSLESQKRILEKSIARLNTGTMGLTDAQRDALLAKYQRELGEIGTRLEGLEEASKHPDLGALGDGLVTIMDQRLSELDGKFGELSARIASAQAERAEKPKQSRPPTPPREAPRPAPVVPQPRKAQASMELTTLTQVPAGATPPPIVPLAPQGTVPAPSPQPPRVPEVQPPVVPAEPTTVPDMQPEVQPAPKPATVPDTPPSRPPTTVPEAQPVAPRPADSPPPPKVGTPPIEELDIDGDDADEDDLAKIKRDILKTLNRLDQAEVE